MKELLWGTRPEDGDGAEPHPFVAGTYDPFAPPAPSVSLDLRAYIQILRKARYLTQVRERVDWKLGIGRWTRSRQKPLLFENVKDYPEHRVFTNGLANPLCIALALGFDAGTPIGRVIAQARKRLKEPIAPRMVPTGPVMENVVPASVLDFAQFPMPQWNEQDRGRYLGTWHLNISHDPETGRRGIGMYRMRAIGPRHATINAPKRSTLARQMAKAEAKKMELPMAVAIGAPEATAIAARAVCPAGMDAFDLAGALQQRPVELMLCGHVEAPAHAEILIEGFVHPEKRVEDGPYFDYHGRPKTNPKAYLFEATRIMHRDDPIFRGSTLGKPGAEDYQVQEFLEELNLPHPGESRLWHFMHTLFS
ncbi:MAG TPA: UbiD family decarboxylase [Acidobacteriaceae bacterium]|nr:UbiD family decarboxylase [Acidobacteriaceae bacterium]